LHILRPSLQLKKDIFVTEKFMCSCSVGEVPLLRVFAV
jgi:hypothetical protein